MGSPSFCYREIIKNYIQRNVFMTERQKDFSDEVLNKMTEKELEDTAKKFNRSHRSYAHYVAGLAVSQFVEDWHKNCDIMNACGGAIAEFFDLVGICEPDNIDFDDT